MNKRFESLLISAILLSPVALVTTSQLATTVQADTFDKINNLCTQKNGLKARHYNLCSTLKNYFMHMPKNVCIFLCIIFYNSKKSCQSWHSEKCISCLIDNSFLLAIFANIRKMCVETHICV